MTSLTALSASELARGIRDRRFSSSEVVEAHILRLEAVDPQLNAVAVPLYAQARRDAAAADAALRSGAVSGPLHGVPMTIKEQFLMAGTATTFGLAREAGHRAKADGPLIRRLREAGAIFLAKTNVAQLLFYVESDNPVYGRTNNPWDLTRTCGGSTGGEAALIAAQASPLGIGGDIGGSIREPAHFCGIAGFKPTSGRLTNLDTRGGIFPAGQGAILAQPGPMARTVEDLDLAMKILAAPGLERIDPSLAPVPWHDPATIEVSRLRIAVDDDDGYFSASPAIRRVVVAAADALRRAGAKVEPWTPPDVAEAMRLFFGILTADALDSLRRALGSDPPEPQLELYLKACALSAEDRATTVGELRAAGQVHIAALIAAVGARSAESYWRLVEDQGRYRARFLEQLDRGRFDAIISPPAALPALRHGDTAALPDYDSYARVFNVLGFPAGVVAAGRVRPGEESDRAPTRDGVLIRAREVELGSAGLPVGVQVAARPWRDDVVLAVMAVLEEHFKQQPDFPLAGR